MYLLLKKIYSEISGVHMARYSAALAFYAIYALAPMIIIFVSIGSLTIGESLAEEQIVFYFEDRLGEKAAEFFDNMLTSIKESEAHLFFSFVGFLVMIYGLSHFFSTLREAFFSIFGIHFGISKDLPKTFLNFMKSAGYTFSLAILISFLLIVNSTAPIILGFSPFWLVAFLSGIPFIDFLFAFILTVFILTFTYRLVSAFGLKWKHAFIGALIAALFLAVLNMVLALYFSLFGGAHAIYGASASLVAFLLWVYYSTKALLLGGLAAQVSNKLQ